MPSAIQYDEKELFRQIAEGNEAAFRAIFDGYRERLFTFAWQLCHSAVDAEEIVQDIFLKLWEQRDKLAEVSFPRKYIYIMTRNRTLDLLGKIARNEQMIKEVWVQMSQSDNLTENLLQAEESRKLIQQAVAQLSEKKQTIFLLNEHTNYRYSSKLGDQAEATRFIDAVIGMHAFLLQRTLEL